ncbi:MAG: histidinol-phosphate transaminase [Chthonomonadales bacterium]|nr:histidinol-phosphate transaminase [Chthonomonadales bacterium]
MLGTARSTLGVGENVTRLVPYRPGKPIEEVKRELGLTDVIKLASNENPLGPSALAVQAIRAAAEQVSLYPEGSCHELRGALAAHLGVPGDHLTIGNGSDEIIQLLGLVFLEPGDEVVQAHPSFVRYESAATLNGADCVKVPLRDWAHDLPAMADRITARTRLVFVANPNNPTGTMVTHSEVVRLADAIPDRAVLVMDEAYHEYVERADYPDTLKLVREGRNLVVLRTFSKIHGLAGLRVGYGIARPEITGYLNQVREPFNVNLVAQAAAVAALRDAEHPRRSREVNAAGRRQFYATLDALGLAYAPSEANFVWMDVGRECGLVFQYLLRGGVITRTGDIFGADTWLRVTVGTPEQNERFLGLLKEVVGQ